MQRPLEIGLENYRRRGDAEFDLRTVRHYGFMQRVSETTSAKRAEMRKILQLVRSRLDSGDQATRNHYRDLELRLKEALRML